MSKITGWERIKINEKGNKIRWWDNIFSKAFILVYKKPKSNEKFQYGMSIYAADGREASSIADLKGGATTQKGIIDKAIRYMKKHPKG